MTLWRRLFYLSVGACLALAFLVALGVSADVVRTGGGTTVGGGGGASFPFAGLATFGTANGAADSVSLNETAGCITFEGTVSDAIQGRICATTFTSADVLVQYSGASGLATFSTTATIFRLSPAGGNWDFSSTQVVPPSNALLNIPGTAGGGGVNWSSTGGSITSTTTAGSASPLNLRASVFNNDVRCGDEDLTESAATEAVRVPVANAMGTSAGVFEYTIYANDASNMQSRSSAIKFNANNIAGAETCVIAPFGTGTADASIAETEDANLPNISSGTLTYAITCASNAADTVDISINAVSSLTQTAFKFRGNIRTMGTNNTSPTCR